MNRRLAAGLLATILVAALAPVPAVGLDAGASNSIEVAGGAAAVNDPLVAVAISTTDPSVTTLRISLDGSSWQDVPLAPTVDISLIDPALGGIDDDREVTVWVAFGDGAAFGDPVTDKVRLDRQPPAWDAFSLPAALSVFDPTVDTSLITDLGGSGLAGWRYSFDDVRWAGWRVANVLDFRDPAAGGSWTQGTRQAWVQARDAAGNESPVYTAPTSLSVEPYYDIPVTMEYPLPAVTGQPFTARPVLPLGMAPPPGAICYWRLSWGNHAALYDMQWDASWGRVTFTIRASKGGCGPWTFTLPFAPTLTYRLEWSMCVLDGSSCQGTSQTDDQLAARWGSSDRHITSSSLPLAYILPTKDMTAIGDSITYTLHTAGGYVVPTRTEWGAQCACRAPGLMPIVQHGGSSFTFTPDTIGDWPVSWTGGSGFFETQAEFDPAVRRRDTTPPTTSPPVARLGGGVPDGTIPVTVSWSGKDIGWGIGRYRLWKSVDGGAWTSVYLPRPTTTKAVIRVVPGHAVRFRVRAWDRAGLAGSYDVGPVLRPGLVSDASTAVRYAGTWTTLANATALGGSLHESSTAGATVRYTFTGRDVAWLAERGPGRGRATVQVDGVVVATVDLGTTSELARRIVFARHWSATGTHTIAITVQGTAGRPRVSVDGFAILR